MLIQQKQAVFPIAAVNGTATANAELNSVNMALYNHAAFFVQFATNTIATGSALTITLESATSDSGDTADVTFHYSWSATSDVTASNYAVYAADATASVISTSTQSDYAGKTLILQVDGDELRSTSLGKVYNWLTVDIDNATTGALSAWVVLSEPRYGSASMPIAV